MVIIPKLHRRAPESRFGELLSSVPPASVTSMTTVRRRVKVEPGRDMAATDARAGAKRVCHARVVGQVLVDALFGQRGFFRNPRRAAFAPRLFCALRQLIRRLQFRHQLTDAARCAAFDLRTLFGERGFFVTPRSLDATSLCSLRQRKPISPQ